MWKSDIPSLSECGFDFDGQMGIRLVCGPYARSFVVSQMPVGTRLTVYSLVNLGGGGVDGERYQALLKASLGWAGRRR